MVVFAIAACSEHRSSPQQLLQQLQSSVVVEHDTAALNIEPDEVPLYLQTDRPDPFLRKRYLPASEQITSTAVTELMECQSGTVMNQGAFSDYRIEQLQFRGVMLSAQQAARAIVMTPDLQWHQVMVGDYLASSYSRVVQITPQAILLESREAGDSGCDRWQIHPVYVSNAANQWRTQETAFNEE